MIANVGIERSDGRGFGRQQLLADSIENFISHLKNKDSLGPDMMRKHLNLSGSCREA